MRLPPRPIVLGSVLLLALGAFSALDRSARVEAWRRLIRGYNVGLTMSTRLALGTARDGGGLDLEKARAILERTVALRTPGLRSAVLLEGGHVLARAGNAIERPEDVPESGERVKGDRLILWRSLAAPSAPPVPEYGLAAPRHPPPPRPEELVADISPARLEDTASVDGVLAFGYDVSLRGARARSELVDLASRVGLLGVGLAGLWGAYFFGRRSQRQADALEAEKARSKSLAQIGVTAAGLAHETKNPLGIIMGLAQQISRDDAVPREHRVRAKQIIDAADRASSRLGEFIHYTRLRDPALARVDLAAVGRATLEVLEPDAAAAGVTLVAEIVAGAVRADEHMLQQIVVNLVLNAVQASPAGSRVVLRATASGVRARLEVEDQGRGIDPELLPRLFEPYVTGRPDGHGLGLAIVRRLVELHGWTVALESEPGKGTRVRIDGLELLPRVEVLA